MTPERIAELEKLCRTELIEALNCQRQLDFDGCEVGVSRQACDEAIALLTALPELLAELTRITREQQEERADWYRFGTFMSQFDLGDKDGGTDAVVDNWIEGITRLTRERDEAYEAGMREAGSIATLEPDLHVKSEYQAGYEQGRNAASVAIYERATAIRALRKPETGGE